MDFTFAQLRQWANGRTIADVPCPNCLEGCKTLAGRKRKCLRIYDEKDDFITYTCARCSTTGYATPDDGTVTRDAIKIVKTPVEKSDKSGLCNFLWDKSAPAIGSLAQVYLESRQCWPSVLCQNIRFLAAREHKGQHYPPAMIARFGFPEAPITGVHLTKLAPDGRAKAGTDADKLTMGDTVGQPIVIHSNPAHRQLIISEGIEDTATLTNVTGWNGWAAGTAGRIPAVVAVAAQRGFAPIYVTRDTDWSKPDRPEGQRGASKRALEQAAMITPIIPVSFGRLTEKSTLDANAMFRRHGAVMVKASIDWCEIQERWARGELQEHHEMQRLLTPLRKILQ